MTKEKSAHELYLEALENEKTGGDAATTVKILQSARKLKSSDAAYALANLHIHGKYVEKDAETARKYLIEAASGLNKDAFFDLAVMYENGEVDGKGDKDAFESYLKAMIAGDRSAIYEVARCLYYGIGVPESKALHDVLRDCVDLFSAE